MDLLAHFVVGLWLYSHYQYPLVVLLSVIPDIDHLVGYIYDRRKKTEIKLPKLIHLAYRPRSWFHSFTGVLIIGLPLLIYFPWYVVFIPLLFHMFLDMLDKEGIYILPPFISKRIRGALPVGYLPEDPSYMKKHKRSHLPSILVILAIAILSLLRLI